MRDKDSTGTRKVAAAALIAVMMLVFAGCSSSPSSDPEGTCDAFAKAVETYSSRVGFPLALTDGGIIFNDIEQPGSSLNDRAYPLLFCSRTFTDPNSRAVTVYGSVAAPGPGQIYCDSPTDLSASEDNELTDADIQQLAGTTKTVVQSCYDQQHNNSLVGQDGSWEANVGGPSSREDNPLADSDKFKGLGVIWLNLTRFSAKL